MARSHDLKQVYCTIGGVQVGGYGEDGGVEFEWDEEPMAKKVSADGPVTFSKTNNKALNGTITVLQSSLAYRRLAELQQAQEGAIGPIAPLPFLLFDAISGTRVASQDCVFMSRPAPSMSKEVGDRVFEFCLPAPQVQHGPGITV